MVGSKTDEKAVDFYSLLYPVLNLSFTAVRTCLAAETRAAVRLHCRRAVKEAEFHVHLQAVWG